MYSIINKLLNVGHNPDLSRLVNLGRRMYNFDLLLGMLMPFFALLLYSFFGVVPNGFLPFMLLIPVYYALNYVAVHRGFFFYSVLITFVLNFVLLLTAGLLMEPILVPLIGVSLALNGFIFLPGRKELATFYFVFFFVTCLGLGAIDLLVKLEKLDDYSRLPSLMATPLIIFGCMLLIKTLQMVYLFQKIIQIKNEKAESYHDLFQYNPTAMIELGPDLKIRHFNQHFLDLLGLQPSEAEDRPFENLLTCDASKELITSLKRLSWNPQKGCESRLELICRKGKSVRSNVSMRVKVDDTGKIKNVFLSIWDITELTQAQTEKKEKEALLEAVFNANANNLIWSIDRDYLFTSFNQPFRQIYKEFFGLEPKLNHSSLDDVPTIFREAFQKQYNKALNGIAHELDQPSTVPDSVKGYWKFYFRPIRNEANEVTGVAVYANDLTKEKLTENALRESEKSFRRIFQDNQQGIHVSDPANAVRFVQELMAKGVTDIAAYAEAHPEDIPKLLDRDPVAANDRLIEIFEFKDQAEYIDFYKHRKIRVANTSLFAEIQAYVDGKPSFEGETSVITKSGATKYVRYKVVFPANP
ncbi:MAG: PAS domain S-box protein, partial [Bacteroidota bacterium]